MSILDELLLIVPRNTPLKFDSSLGFHLYGADLCLQAAELGLAVVAIQAPCKHNTQHDTVPDAFLESTRSLPASGSAGCRSPRPAAYHRRERASLGARAFERDRRAV